MPNSWTRPCFATEDTWWIEDRKVDQVKTKPTGHDDLRSNYAKDLDHLQLDVALAE